MSYIAVVTTVGTLAEAEQMARSLVEQRLAACAQISKIESFYRWNEVVQNEAEFRVLFKTTRSQYESVEHAIRTHHSYELPAIHSTALERVYGPYGEWLERHCQSE